MNDRLLTMEDLADRWGVGVDTLRRWRRAGKMPKEIRLNGSTAKGVRYAIGDVIAHEETLKQTSSAQEGAHATEKADDHNADQAT